MNPFYVLSTQYNLITVTGVTAGLFVALKYLTHGLFKEIILIGILLALGVCSETMWSYSSYTNYYMMFYMLGYSWNLFPSSKFMTLILAGLLFLNIAIPGLMYLYRSFTVSGLSISGWFPVLVLLLMCWQLTQVQTPVYSVLILEMIAIVLYFYVRTWMKQSNGGSLIVHNPCELNKTTSYKITDQNQYTYTVTFWFKLDATSPGFSSSANEYTDMVLYGDNVLVAYNSSINTVRIILKNTDKKYIYDISNVPLQKWNQIALLYANGTFDIFMNGELQKSVVAVPKPSNHEVLVGAEQGIRGKLCTLMFYNKVLTMDQLQGLYTQFKDKNPPTV
jgi:uncharacterized membrane protein